MGSVSDLQRLVRALDAYELSEKTFELVGGRAAIDTMNCRYVVLVSASRAAGYQPNLRETCHAWAKRRVATFAAVLPMHAAEARNQLNHIGGN